MQQIACIAVLRVRNIVLCWDNDINIYDRKLYDTVLKLKRIANVFAVVDIDGLLGGIETKCAPVDCGENTWIQLYKNRKRL